MKKLISGLLAENMNRGGTLVIVGGILSYLCPLAFESIAFILEQAGLITSKGDQIAAWLMTQRILYTVFSVVCILIALKVCALKFSDNGSVWKNLKDGYCRAFHYKNIFCLIIPIFFLLISVILFAPLSTAISTMRVDDLIEWITGSSFLSYALWSPLTLHYLFLYIAAYYYFKKLVGLSQSEYSEYKASIAQ